MTIVTIHTKLEAGIIHVEHLADQLGDESTLPLTSDQRKDFEAMMAGVNQFKLQIQEFPDFSTQTPQQLSTMRHDLRNHLNLIGGFAFVFATGLGGEMPAEKIEVASQIHLLSKSLIKIVNKIA